MYNNILSKHYFTIFIIAAYIIYILLYIIITQDHLCISFYAILQVDRGDRI